MNKTITVNLGGTVFHIDDNAYEVLIKYLNAIKSHFSVEQGRDEIMQDIESRIGEMFRDRMKDTRQVITLMDVEEVTRMMGRPEQFGEEETSNKETSADEASVYKQYKRRMFRNPDDKVLGGVCSGIASYFDIDPVWIRLAFVGFLFLYGTGFWLYIILWIILPEAKTTADKLMMKGEPVTVSNIEKNVKEELESVKQRLNKERNTPASVAGRILSGIVEIFKFVFIAIGKVIAFFFLIIGLFIALVLFASLFGIAGAPFVHYPEFIGHVFVSKAMFGWTYIGAVLVVGIPCLMLAYGGARMLFNLKKRSKIVGFAALGLWIIGLLLVLVFGIRTAREFSERDSFRKEVAIQQPGEKFFLLKTDEIKTDEKDYEEHSSDDYIDDEVHLQAKGEKLLSRNVRLDVVQSPTDSFDLVEIFYARGNSRKAAIDNASKISYSFTQSDFPEKEGAGIISFDRHYSISEKENWRSQKVQLLLRVPIGGKVKLDKSLEGLIYDIDNVQNIYDRDMINRTWVMTDKGLSCEDCTGYEATVGGDPVIFHGDDGAEIMIEKGGGVRISGGNGDKVTVGKSGVHVRKDGKDIIKIDESGVLIIADSSAKKK